MGVVTSLVAGTIGTAALIAGAATATTMAMTKKPKKPVVDPITGLPTPTSAAEKARLKVEKERRIRALAGGKTLLAEDRAGVGKTLLGE